MAPKPTLTFVLMDPPYENARTTTALRLLDIAARRGYNLNVFAYEGAVYVPFSKLQCTAATWLRRITPTPRIGSRRSLPKRSARVGQWTGCSVASAWTSAERPSRSPGSVVAAPPTL